MRRLFILVAAVSMAVASHALAADGGPSHANGGLGFHSTEAPIGVRWWFSGQKVGLDLGLGFSSTPATADGYPDESLKDWALDVGVPICFRSWDRVHVNFRPGLLYQSSEYTISDATPPPPEPFDTENATSMLVTAELEAEVFLADNLSVSASHGIGFLTVDPGGTADSQTSFGTFGRNFTEVGFHYYFFGGGQ